MRPKIIMPFLLALLPMYSSAQEETSKNKIRFTGLSATIGPFVNNYDMSEPITSFQKLAPNSSLAFRNLDGFVQNRFISLGINAASIDFMAHFTKPNKEGKTKKWNPEFSIGISYNPIELLNSYYDKETITRVDTVTSNQTGQEVYIDSIVNESINFKYEQELVYLNVRASVSTNPMKRWRVALGVETSLGYTIFARTFLSEIQFSRIEKSDGSFFRGPITNGPEFEYEEVNNERGISTRIALPVVLSFRLSKDLDKQLSQCILTLENRPNFTYYNISELDTEFLYTNIVSLGFRYSI